jgi:hypothetical protein
MLKVLNSWGSTAATNASTHIYMTLWSSWIIYNQASLSLYFEHSVSLKKKDAKLVPQGARVRKATREYNKYHLQGFQVTRLSNNTPF